MLRIPLLATFGLGLLACSPAEACMLSEIQKTNMREEFCSTAGSFSLPGCTAKVMRSQASDQLKEIALARRCGFKSQADELETYYKATTPLVAKLYACVDQPFELGDVERLSKQDVDTNLQSLPDGCPDDLKSKLTKRLPKELAEVKTSLRQAKGIAEQLQLSGN